MKRNDAPRREPMRLNLVEQRVVRFLNEKYQRGITIVTGSELRRFLASIDKPESSHFMPERLVYHGLIEEIDCRKVSLVDGTTWKREACAWAITPALPDAAFGDDYNPKSGRTRRKANADGRGRKLVDDDATTRRDILRDWKRAKEAGLTAKEFCKRERERADGPSYLTERYLRKLVSWAAKQKSRRR
jgi:hypothetical protein